MFGIRPALWRLTAVLGLVLSINLVFGQQENCDTFSNATETADGALIAYGQSTSYNGANVTTFVTGSCDGPPQSVGFTITAPEGLVNWLGSLPNEMETMFNVSDSCKEDPLGLGCIPPNDLIALEFPTYTPFQWLGLNWNPIGHPPVGAYDRAHFDMHFYIESQETINSIVPSQTKPCTEGLSPESFYKANTPVPAACFPDGYANLNAVAPFMGNHYVFLEDPVIAALLKGAPNGSLWKDTAFIMGGYDGQIAFFEPMVRITTIGDLIDQGGEKKCQTPSVPKEYPNPGYYPTSFCLEIVGNDTLVVTLEGMTQQEGTGCGEDVYADASYVNAFPAPPGTPPLPDYCKAPLLKQAGNESMPGDDGTLPPSEAPASSISSLREGVLMNVFMRWGIPIALAMLSYALIQ
jgi:hypothetical protein